MSKTTGNGLLIDYEFCTGCHGCEIACKKVLGLAPGEVGMALKKDGPRKKPDGRWELNYIPVPTELCDLCADRVAEGRKPKCVHHCQALCIEYGSVSELAKKMTKGKMVLFTPANANA
ncbi:MAG TPA: oxidoreductase [Syntrophomonas sp.]|nr:oxidoreductase [Syntrophomonas sp.]